MVSAALVSSYMAAGSLRLESLEDLRCGERALAGVRSKPT
eukprot:CAMPEP_0197923552 /NCGR_PEP_ID=MMETSP1439-20131203/94179_1 /TAXON_ID=66791 /ORGANISM="Gonyaulax spinifera, Strain CCMP409" /LENGTH=39 /DNA_ID= /DNA_START= /DNA_END= /DNA_ORIENTATION=